ncbi:hypothetical protein LWI28_013026 [Acer negundo]|uniref:RRM domain-containing protein n=1 Tax=Acer negundo TaxID=4023 RepID=A0AAD5NEQ2_ACENE|nr:hypothetical protein LWI28_013026 [Acer negundo]
MLVWHHLSSSFYVGDLDFRVTDSQLYRVFNEMGGVVYRDMSTGRSLGYGYVNYNNITDTRPVIDTMNLTTLNGNPIRITVATDLSGQSKGYDYVLFDNEEAATSAIDKLNGTPLKDKQAYVGPYLRKHRRDSSSRFNNVYVKNLS